MFYQAICKLAIRRIFPLWVAVGMLYTYHSSGQEQIQEIEPLLAKVYSQEDISSWWISEKLDGVRAIWNGEQLHFRSGRLIYPPAWFAKDFPARPMDGELWIGRGSFDRLSGIVRREYPEDIEWRDVRYMLFELPDSDGTFTQRVAMMGQLTRAAGIPWLQPIEQIRLQSEAALMELLDEVVEHGGEGLMLHRADSLYHGGRSDDLLKLKLWQDAEAVVVAVLPGKGKYVGMMGSLLVENGEGQRFRIGSGFSDQERRNPPPVGTTITYKYTGTTSRGLPRFASFLRIRPQF